MLRALCSQVRSFLPPKQKRDTPRNFKMKRLFRNAFSERSKRSEKERDERSLLGVPGPCSQVRPFLLAELKRDTPRNFDMKRLIRNAFSERPNLVPPQNSPQTPSRPLPPPPLSSRGRAPPRQRGFSMKTDPRPSWRLALSLPLPRAEKKKNIRNVHHLITISSDVLGHFLAYPHFASPVLRQGESCS